MYIIDWNCFGRPLFCTVEEVWVPVLLIAKFGLATVEITAWWRNHINVNPYSYLWHNFKGRLINLTKSMACTHNYMPQKTMGISILHPRDISVWCIRPPLVSQPLIIWIRLFPWAYMNNIDTIGADKKRHVFGKGAYSSTRQKENTIWCGKITHKNLRI